MKNVLAIIQARMGSTRFPGKVLADLNGKPLVLHCIEAASAAGAHPLVLMTDDPRDRELFQFLANDSRVVNGPACGCRWKLQQYDSLLRSYLDVAEQWGYDAIVRICADSPMVTPERIRRAALAVQAGASYCGFLDCTKPHPLSKRGDACEAFSIGTLRYEAEVATEAECHQHVTWGMYMPPANICDRRPYRLHWLPLPAAPRYPAIDTPEDLETLRAMLNKEAACV